MSVFLGTMPKGRRRVRDVILNSEGHVSICAGPGSFKTTSVVCPSLIRGIGHSSIILDPSGENYSICAPALRRAGVDVKVMSAFPGKVSKLIKQDLHDVGCDIYSGMSFEMPGPEIRAALKKRARWLVPDEPDQDAKDRFFVADARELIEFVSMYLMVKQRMPTLPAIHDVLMQGMQNLSELYIECEEKYPDYFGGAFSKLAQSFGGVQAAAGQQAAGGFGQAKLSVSHFDESSELGRHTSRSEWDPSELGDPNQQIALFLIGTLEMMEAYAGPTAMTLMYLFDTIASQNRGGRVTALLDECGSLSLTSLPSSLLFYRKTGLRCVMIWQDLEGQAQQKMGRHGVKQILSGSRYLMISGGSTEWETLERFSKLCGTRTIRDASLNRQTAYGDVMNGMSDGAGYRDLPVMRPEEIQLMGRDKWLLVGGDTPPMILNKVCYWERPEWRAIAGPSPYYRG